MAENKKLVRELRSGAIAGSMAYGMHGEKVGSPTQIVYDGDTLNGRALANVPVRFLGIDTPELKIPLPASPDVFVSLSDPRWDAYLTARDLPKDCGLSAGLAKYLAPKLEGAATNHHLHGKAAEKALTSFVIADRDTYFGGKNEAARFFLYYAKEVVDRYGRFLAYINVNLPDTDTAKRPPFYNERMLEAGFAKPYAIWPNVDPFVKAPTLLDAVIPPGGAKPLGKKGALGRARRIVQAARQGKLGVFGADAPLLLEAFEIRYLSRQAAPDRWVIDLSKESDRLIAPQEYYTVPHAEDRLFVPAEYVPLFMRAGWKGADDLEDISRCTTSSRQKRSNREVASASDHEL